MVISVRKTTIASAGVESLNPQQFWVGRLSPLLARLVLVTIAPGELSTRSPQLLILGLGAGALDGPEGREQAVRVALARGRRRAIAKRPYPAIRPHQS